MAPIELNRFPKGVQELAADAPIDDIQYLLKRDGGVVVKQLIPLHVIERMNAETKPYLDQDIMEWQGSFFPPTTQKCAGLTERSPTYVKEVLTNDVINKVVTPFLETKSTVWIGDERKELTIKPKLNSAFCFKITAGSFAQPLHRDDYIHHNVHDYSGVWDDEKDMSRETAVGFFVAGAKTTFENGATQFIPGSHLWDMKRIPKTSECCYSEMDPGDCFFMFASSYHGGGSNRTKDDFRLLYASFMVRGNLRQEENQYLIGRPETLKTFDQKAHELIGYSKILEAGWVGTNHALDHLQNGILLI